MKEIEREIGILQEQGRWMSKELHEIKSDVKSLVAMKWKIYGIITVITVISTGLFQILLVRIAH